MARLLSVIERDLMDELADEVVDAAREVAASLGTGFDRDVYESALVGELNWRHRGVVTRPCEAIRYKGKRVSGYSADLIVAGLLPLELVCGREFTPADLAEYEKYLVASGHHFGLILRFEGSRVRWERVDNPELLVAA